jgi:sortase (surface protein transpeptidase)
VGIDISKGVLGVPPPILRTGWWKDGAAPGARTGAILIAGHVDRAGIGPGAFFKLHEAKVGDHVTVNTRGGRAFTYRVVSVHTYLKRNRRATSTDEGPPAPVLHTCAAGRLPVGGPLPRQRRPTAVPI